MLEFISGFILGYAVWVFYLLYLNHKKGSKK